ncbi:MAG: hypothetical protein PHI72_07455 [Atribacterota bacterium]|jgi:hypothetical protein|nr:hypothetical protein [Atribacterota bacterium]MDD5637586.1 hypothetical protein [Atribacterota bacterium]
MKEKDLSSKRVIIISTLAILFSTFFAIIIHAMLPVSLDVKQFNSIWVKWFGFPVISTFYFLFLFTHCVIMVRYIGLRVMASQLQIGIRLGIVYAMMYILGMQEVIVKYSPFSRWNLEFVKYQFLIGIGDGIPALLLCLVISYFTLNSHVQVKEIKTLGLIKSIKIISITAIAFFIGRVIFYQIGLIDSECAKYPIPCYVWTALFGILMGCIYVILYPLWSYGNALKLWSLPLRFALSVGLNWIIFNSFIGLIIKGTMFQMFLRSGLDILVLFLISMALGINEVSSPHMISRI